MPDHPKNRQCIICGLPSETVVCVRCFFSYDYRTYNNRVLEKKRMQKEIKTDLSDHSIETENRDQWPIQNELIHDLPRIDIEETPAETNPVNNKERISSSYWFSRLSRF